MSKLKTHKTTVKRFKVTGSGKLVARKMSVAHRSRFKSKRALKNTGQTRVVEAAVAKKLLRVI